MTIVNQNGSGVRTENDVGKIHLPSWAEKISTGTSKKTKTGVKEPVKLLFQTIYYLAVFIPFTIWAIASHFFTKRKSIRNNVVMVTGSGRGLGRGLALKFAELECKIACVDIDEINNAETVRLIKLKYPSVVAIPYKCNIANEDDVKYVSKNITNDLGDVDIIVNNAGIVSGACLIKSKLEMNYLNVMLDVNLKSHFVIIGEFLPKMMQRNSGHIVAISSLAGLNGVPNASVYSATKHGLIGLMESLYDELRTIPNNKIQTTCICPYFITTHELYAKHWDTRLPELSTRQATEATVDAILKNRRIVSIPSSLYFFSILTRLFPDSIRNLQRDIFYTNLDLPDDETLGNHIDQIIEDLSTRKTPSQNENEEKIITSQ